jgi:hypothetical protein
VITFLLTLGLFLVLWIFCASIFIGALAEITTRTDLLIWLAGTFLMALIATLLVYWGIIE